MILMKKRPLFCFAAFFGAGVIGAYLLNPPPVWMLLCGALLGILALGLALPGRRKLTAAALTAFQKMRRERQAAVSSVTEVTPCYELQSATSAAMSLVPAWCITTDTGMYYVNCISGAVSSD